MKKRIGSKLYDTDKAVCVIPELNLYKQENRQTYFIYDGTVIQPLDFSEAKKFLVEYNITNITLRKPAKNGVASLHVSPEAADHLASYRLLHGVTQKQVIEDFIATLEP